jgi:hypothetical protein
LQFRKNLILNGVLYLVLQNDYFLKEMFDGHYDVLGITLCELLNSCRIDVILRGKQTLESFFILHLLEVDGLLFFARHTECISFDRLRYIGASFLYFFRLGGSGTYSII